MQDEEIQKLIPQKEKNEKNTVTSELWNDFTFKGNSLVVIEIKKTLNNEVIDKCLKFERYNKLVVHLRWKGVEIDEVCVVILHDGKANMIHQKSEIEEAHKEVIISNNTKYPQIKAGGTVFVPLFPLYQSLTKLRDVNLETLLDGYVDILWYKDILYKARADLTKALRQEQAKDKNEA